MIIDDESYVLGQFKFGFMFMSGAYFSPARHDKGSQTRLGLGLIYFCDPSAWR